MLSQETVAAEEDAVDPRARNKPCLLNAQRWVYFCNVGGRLAG